MELLLGGLAAVGAGIVTNPLEVVKIRMQLQGELQSKGKHPIHYRNVFHAFYTIGVKDGVLALQKGLGPALWYQFVMNGTRLGVYDVMDKRGFTRNKDGKIDPLKSMLTASCSGALGASIGSPFYLIKTHLQSQANEASIAVGHQHTHSGMVPAVRSIYGKYGVLGLWRGVSSTLPRVVVASAVQLSTFEKSLELVRHTSYVTITNRWASAFLASLISGIFVSVCMAPFDLVSTRFYNQGVDPKGKGLLYSSVVNCAMKIYNKEGITGFFKGWSANYFRIGPHTLLSLMLWDQFKHYYKASSNSSQ